MVVPAPLVGAGAVGTGPGRCHRCRAGGRGPVPQRLLAGRHRVAAGPGHVAGARPGAGGRGGADRPAGPRRPRRPRHPAARGGDARDGPDPAARGRRPGPVRRPDRGVPRRHHRLRHGHARRPGPGRPRRRCPDADRHRAGRGRRRPAGGGGRRRGHRHGEGRRRRGGGRRPARRAGRPGSAVRVAARGEPADRHRDLRGGQRDRPARARLAPGHRGGLHHAADDPGGARRRHRLRVAAVLPVPRRAGGRRPPRGGGAHRPGHRGPHGVLRRGHRDHRAAGSGCAGPGLAAGRRGGRGAHRPGHHARRIDPAAGAADDHRRAGGARGAPPGRARPGHRGHPVGPLVDRRPAPAALLGAALLLALAAPALDMRLGLADAGNGAPSRTSRQAYDLLAQGFGPGFNGPLILVVTGGTPAATSAGQTLRSTPGVAAVSPPLPTQDPDTSMVVVYPDAKPQDARTQELVTRLRGEVLPALAHRAGARFLVGGTTAAIVDFAAAVSARLPLFVAVVVGLSALLLMAVFRSLLIPLKAAVLNLLSVGASLGAVTLVFQHGVLGGPLGIEPGPIEAFVPVIIFAIAFGLSMDYEVFLLARVHEEWERSHDATAAIRAGMSTTGRIVTAAAAIMVVVFAPFLLDPGRMLKQFGLGLAVAVLLDALVIRCLIVPAVMQLFGGWAWRLPARLDRVLPRLALERRKTPPHPSSRGSFAARGSGTR